jgi:hypothetical protein
MDGKQTGESFSPTFRGANIMTEMLIQALEYAKAGYHVFPCQPKGKAPLAPKGHKDATIDKRIIREWWEKWPDANIGLSLEPSGLMVIDLDRHPGKPDGVKAFVELKKGHADSKNPPRSNTGGNGVHLVYNRPDGQIKGKLAPSIDIKANGYIILPPSVHPNGETYQWEKERSILELEPIDLPDWLSSLIVKEEPKPNVLSQIARETLQEYPPSSGEKIIQRCAFLKHCAEDAPILPEPDWYQGTIGVLSYTVEAPEIVHKYSLAHPNYTLGDTEAKITHWKRDSQGPATCKSIKDKCGDNYCKSCPFNGRIKSPITLGYPTQDSHINRAFPLEALPKVFQQYVFSASESLQCPIDYVGCAILALTAILIGGQVRIHLKADWYQYANLFIALVGSPASKKSPAMEIVFRLIKILEQGLYTEYQKAMSIYRLQLKQYELDFRVWQKSQSGNQPEEPVKPILRRLTCTDTTVEALCEILANNTHGIGLVCDELASWLRSMNQYKGAGGSDRSQYLSMWNNAQITVDRKGKEPIFIPSPSLTIIGGIQPDILNEMRKSQGMNDGLIERILFTCPSKRLDPPNGGISIPSDVRSAMYTCVEQLFRNRSEELVTIALSDEARRQFIEAETEWHQAIHSEDFPKEMEAFYAKMSNYLGRFALILHTMKRITGESISETVEIATIQEAKKLADYFLDQAHQAMRLFKRNPQEELVHETAAWLKKKGYDSITSRDLQRKRGHRFKTSSKSKEILEKLADYGYGTWNSEQNEFIFSVEDATYDKTT